VWDEAEHAAGGVVRVARVGLRGWGWGVETGVDGVRWGGAWEVGRGLPVWMLQERHEELDGGRRRDRREPRSGDGAHLVERTVREGL
jgi:hypothetical protein